MAWLGRDRNFVRITLLLLLAISILGPWAFDRIHVPAEYTCEPPFVRLDGDFCGSPMSWLSLFSWFTDGFLTTLRHLIAGLFAGRAREFLAVLLVMLPVLPFFSMLLLIWRKNSARLKTIHLIAWGLGSLFPLLILTFEWNGPVTKLWGLWLYILLAIGALLVEIIPTVPLTSTSPPATV
ncbi:MAG TPA: hypothetical protein VK888_02440 [Anaerolineales bacterium]|nr:hypothetical protein [Anaerolineales bacterium]